MSSSKDSWSDADWEAFINDKILEVLSPNYTDSTPRPLADVSSPTDPRFSLAIDHTLLKPETTPEQIDKLCDEALTYGFKSCCVNGSYASQVKRRLDSPANRNGSIPCCVVGFPLGAGSAAAKALEARNAIENGALEIDTVIPLGILLSRSKPHYADIYKHLKTIVEACGVVPLKVILETSLIPSNELKVAACVLSAEAGAAFVKTSTGFAPGGDGATKEDVALMYAAVHYKGSVKVKASGGVRTFAACQEMFKAGAERVGTSSGANIMQNVQPQPTAEY